MNYPVWDLHAFGGGFWIALVAVVHVFVSHFAVGGGLWLVLTERKALKEGDAALLAYVKGHSRFFLLLTMVFGGLTGVGIWWTIALLNPSATSLLIHTFVFGWATEWVCFVGEIVALFVYYATFETMRAREHQIIGWFYFVFAWLSLFLINGIIGFMLTPGGWLSGGGFWAGFFNPSFWPSLVFRTCVALMIAGMFGLVTAVHRRDRAFRDRVAAYSAGWVLAPLAPMAASAWWYLQALPEPQRAMILRRAVEIPPYLQTFVWVTPLLLLGALLAALRTPVALKRPLAWVVLVLGFLQLGSFEFVREAGRRPYVIHGAMYSDSVPVDRVAAIDAAGFLASARWVSHDAVTPQNERAVGEEIFRIQCSGCHSRGGVLNDVVPLTAGLPQRGVEALLAGQGKVVPYMPPFVGTAAERRAVARYIAEGLHGVRPAPEPPTPARVPATDVPPFDPDTASHVLLAWSNVGMRCVSDGDPWFLLMPPGSVLQAQLIARGETPEVVTDGVKLTYRVEEGYEHPSREVPFWDHAASTLGAAPAPDTGTTGKGPSGTLDRQDGGELFEAAGVPLVPYRDGRYEPYPLVTVEARDEESGALLAATRMVAPVGTEMGCRKCHGGDWRVGGVTGLGDATARAILAAHDKRSGTDLLAEAEAGRPKLCGSCHAAPVVKTAGDPGLLSLSAAMHGWHANYLPGEGAGACAMCHPSDPAGPTACLRGAHGGSLDCTRCHGTLEDHALGLLKAEDAAGKPGAARLMAHLEPRAVGSLDEVVPRRPWVQEPDCLACHEDYERPDPATASAVFRWTEPGALYRLNRDESGVLACTACHGSPHALYPAVHGRIGDVRDNLQPLQYQGSQRPVGAGGNCAVCHTIGMEDSIHHANMENL